MRLSDGQITGAEALLRWTHLAKGAISTDLMDYVAEDNGLITQIGAWALTQACTQRIQ